MNRMFLKKDNFNIMESDKKNSETKFVKFDMKSYVESCTDNEEFRDFDEADEDHEF